MHVVLRCCCAFAVRCGVVNAISSDNTKQRQQRRRKHWRKRRVDCWCQGRGGSRPWSGRSDSVDYHLDVPGPSQAETTCFQQFKCMITRWDGVRRRRDVVEDEMMLLISHLWPLYQEINLSSRRIVEHLVDELLLLRLSFWVRAGLPELLVPHVGQDVSDPVALDPYAGRSIAEGDRCLRAVGADTYQQRPRHACSSAHFQEDLRKARGRACEEEYTILAKEAERLAT